MFRPTNALLDSFLRLLIVVLLACGPPSVAAGVAPITILTIDDAIGPANADYVVRGIAHAARDGSQLVVLQLDTPGGLDLSMRSIIKAILTSPVPVAAFVAPSGARAASAGTYIMYASHIAAMAPGTNLGAATPIQIGGPGPGAEPDKPAARREDDKRDEKQDEKRGNGADTAKPSASALERKAVNDAAAYLRGLAQLRGRNAEWAERSVREGLSLSAEEALKLHVIDRIAPDIGALAASLDGTRVAVRGGEVTLQTRGAPRVALQPGARSKLLTVITNPSVALILMSIGVYGLLFEFMSPGAVAPGVIGAICLLLAMYGLQLLPVNYAGLALIFLGIMFMVAEAFLPSFGVVGLGGVAAFIAGALILIDTEMPGFGIPLGLIAAVALISAALIVATAGVALRTRRRGAVGDNLLGGAAEMLDDAVREGWANAGGETWRVVSPVPLAKGQAVRIVGRKGATLEVVPIESQQGRMP